MGSSSCSGRAWHSSRTTSTFIAGGTKQYLASFLALRQRKAADKVQQAARKVREQEDAQRQAYDRYRRSEAVDIFAALPKSEQGIIKGLAQTHAAKFEGSLQDSMA